jgi:hypothetical protein
VSYLQAVFAQASWVSFDPRRSATSAVERALGDRRCGKQEKQNENLVHKNTFMSRVRDIVASIEREDSMRKLGLVVVTALALRIAACKSQPTVTTDAGAQQDSRQHALTVPPSPPPSATGGILKQGSSAPHHL